MEPKTKESSGRAFVRPRLLRFLVALAVVALGIPVPSFAQNSISIVGSLVTPLSLMYIGINLQQSGLGTLRIDRDTFLALAGRFYYFPNVNGIGVTYWRSG